ncbi:hypothetical protein VNO78_33063 [Psophocarpus tetragonolobus]|uniref:Uncharacterized protein n=1 Tax=Psophocarpus tetragonolobus TaxID=3891 RepID=A0AAN9NW97_PSOTE
MPSSSPMSPSSKIELPLSDPLCLDVVYVVLPFQWARSLISPLAQLSTPPHYVQFQAHHFSLHFPYLYSHSDILGLQTAFLSSFHSTIQCGHTENLEKENVVNCPLFPFPWLQPCPLDG